MQMAPSARVQGQHWSQNAGDSTLPVSRSLGSTWQYSACHSTLLCCLLLGSAGLSGCLMGAFILVRSEAIAYRQGRVRGCCYPDHPTVPDVMDHTSIEAQPPQQVYEGSRYRTVPNRAPSPGANCQGAT